MNRGSLVLLLSYVAPLASAYGIFIVLSRVLSTSEFADFGVVNAGVTLLNAVLAGGTIQAVSRRVAASSGASIARLRKKALGRQLAIAAAVALVLALLSPLLARALGDPSLQVLLALAATIPPAYTLTAVQQGALNGAGQLGGQGALNLILSVLRFALVVAAVVLGAGVRGALIAILAASLLTFAASFFIKLDASHAPAPAPAPRGATGRVRIKDDTAIFVVAQVLLQILLAADLFVLKGSLGDEAPLVVALYVAAQTIARIPYGLLLGVPQLAFSRSTRERASESVLARESGLTFALITGLLAVMLAIALPLREPLLLLVYPEHFRGAARVLGHLLVAAGALAVGDVCQAMVSGARGPKSSVAVLAFAVVVELAVAFVFIPRHGAEGAATASLAGACTLAVVGAIVFFVRLRPSVPWAIVGTGLVLGAGSAMASSLLAATDPSPMAALGFSSALGVVVALLFALSARADLALAAKPKAS